MVGTSSVSTRSLGLLLFLAVLPLACSRWSPHVTINHLPLERTGFGSAPSEPVGQDGLLSKAGHVMRTMRATFQRFPLGVSHSRQVLASAAPVVAGKTDYTAQPEVPAEERAQSKHMRASSTTVLKVYPIKGDGRCMFRSISRSLAHSEKRPLAEKMETEDADYLRRACYQVICIDKRDAFEKAKVIQGDMKQYCASMKSPNFYGGEPELFVLSELLRRPITVYIPQQGGFKAIVEYGSKYLSERPRVRILYNGHNHYDSLLD